MSKFTKNTSLAVKYRPQTFDDVVGQTNVITILMNQLESGQTKQSYLFTGGAGTGKTTMARIFAREVNGGVPNSEIIEIDAASNNGVDAVRELRETVKFKPLNSKFKVYIIDEVHMLSTGAFNALLKTLEEPPAHAVFILATTDPQKIPSTILSRVQRFDFKRMTVEQIVSRLQYIIEKENEVDAEYKNPALTEIENYNVGADVLEYLAKLANGGMRNSISLLDTVLGYSSSPSLEDVFEILGVPDFEEYLNILVHLHNAQKPELLRLIEEQHVRGKDIKRFMLGLTEFVVDLQKVALLGNFDFVSIPSNYFERVERAVQVLGEQELSILFSAFVQINSRIKYEANPKVLVQGELLSLC
jgi:DNA polymerase-3 subunit gamma/tau